MIFEQTNITEDYTKLIERFKAFNAKIKELEDSNSSLLDVVKNEPNNPQVVAFREQALKVVNDYYNLTAGIKNNKVKELVEYTKTNLNDIFNTIKEFEKNTENYFGDKFLSDFEPVFSGIEENFREISALKDTDLVSTADAQSSTTPVAPTPSTPQTLPVPPTSPTPSTQPTQPPTPQQPTAPSAPSSKEKSAEEVFNKYMVGPFDPNSSMDRGKMEVVKNMLNAYEAKYGKPFNISDNEDLVKMQPIAKAAYESIPYKQATKGIAVKAVEPALYKTKEGGILGIGSKDVYSPTPPPVGTKSYEVIDPKTGKVTKVKRATAVNPINIPKPGSVRREADGSIRRKSQFGGALGSLSNFFGDVGNTIKNK
jgi:hypothetical protein